MLYVWLAESGQAFWQFRAAATVPRPDAADPAGAAEANSTDPAEGAGWLGHGLPVSSVIPPGMARPLPPDESWLSKQSAAVTGVLAVPSSFERGGQ